MKFDLQNQSLVTYQILKWGKNKMKQQHITYYFTWSLFLQQKLSQNA